MRMAHHQAVARQRQKLVADFGVAMHIAWTRHMLDNRELVVGGGTQPSTKPYVRACTCLRPNFVWNSYTVHDNARADYTLCR